MNQMNDIPFWDAVKRSIRALRDIHHYVPGRIPIIFLHSALKSLSPFATIWLSAQLINELAGMRRPDMLTKWAILAVSVAAVLELTNAVLNRWIAYCQRIHNPQKERIFTDKFLSMDFADAESSHIRDLRSQIRQNENVRGYGINGAVVQLENFIGAMTKIFGAIIMTITLFSTPVPLSSGKLTVLNHPIFPFLLFLLLLLTAVVMNLYVKYYDELFEKLTTQYTFYNRLFQYCTKIRWNEQHRLDIRTYEQRNLLKDARDSDITRPGGLEDRLFKGKYAWIWASAQASPTLISGFAYLFVCMKALGGAIGVGSVTQYVGAITELYSGLSEMLLVCNEIRENAPYLKATYDFLDTPNAMYQGSLTTEKRSDRQYEIEFRDVSFRYPNSESWALRHVSMKFKIGTRLAIVGENGSGKTTFIKLLCRLYDPQEGEILLNGIDIRKYNYRDYQNVFSVVFQDFQLLSQSLGANIAGSMHYDKERVLSAIRDAGLENWMEQMPSGLDTLLYPVFSEDGIQISGGEAQKIAIARAIYKNAPFIILDEPTAALDPISEAEIYSKFNEISGDKTAIYISHRLSSCKFCAEIAVFHEGRIVQQGTHEELVADANGKYHELWNAQAQYYTKESK